MKRAAPGGGAALDRNRHDLQLETDADRTRLRRRFQEPGAIGEIVALLLADLRPPTEVEILELRRSWWRHRAAGVALPAERGVIVIDGGRR